MNDDQARAAALPLTEREQQCVAKAMLAACQAGCHFDNSTTMSVATMAVATLVHWVAREQNLDRAALVNMFISGLDDTLKQIDAQEASQR